MPEIPQVAVFKRSTSPRSILVGYGSKMARVLVALESYWSNRANGQKVEELLLYNLWKECCKWLKLKEDKLNEGNELFMRRKLNVALLRDASMEKLADISPQVAQALGVFQDRKLNQGRLGMNLQPLRNGYDREREFYLQQNKQGGTSLSWSFTQAQLDSKRNERNMKQFRNKQHGDLTLEEAVKISHLYPTEPVVFRNKIERMRNLVTITDSGLMANLDGVLISMDRFDTRSQTYDSYMYAMDKFGNLFIDEAWGAKQYVGYNAKNGGYQVQTTGTFNHSSFLAGEDVVCAGCLHIGYNARKRCLEPGVFDFIDNNSGHYKPTAENLQNCLIALRDQGVDLYDVMVCDRSGGRKMGTCYWALDFIDGMRNPWPDPETPPSGLVKPPPVQM